MGHVVYHNAYDGTDGCSPTLLGLPAQTIYKLRLKIYYSAHVKESPSEYMKVEPEKPERHHKQIDTRAISVDRNFGEKDSGDNTR